VQREIDYFLQRNSVRDWRIVQHLYAEVATRAGRTDAPAVISPKELHCPRDSFVQAVAFDFYRVFNPLCVTVANSAECHRASLSFRSLFARKPEAGHLDVGE
jgi:hypothetical protein